MLLGLICALTAACQSPRGSSDEAARVTPIYNKQTGRLEQLVGDRRGDGKVDARAQMDGAHVTSIAIDRDRDGRPDRWEYYEQAAGGGTKAPPPRSVLVRAEEANGNDGRITRWEYYDKGVIARVEEDTDGDGRIDKWELYQNGALIRMDLDLEGRGFPDHRLIYRPDGTLDRTEVDPAGDRRFAAPAGSAPKVDTRKGRQ